MIEINLLPAGVRTHEGTPPLRFAAYMGSLVILLILGYYIGRCIRIDIPDMEGKISIDKIDKLNLEQRQKEVDDLTAQIETYNKKIADLDDLNLSRVRFARLFDRLTNAVPEGVWFRSFTVAPDASVSRRYQPAGRRYAITMNGNAVGGNAQERDRRIAELLSNLEKQLNIPPDSAPVPNPVPEDYGFCKFIGARFERPRLTGTITTANLAPLTGIDAKLVAQINPPKEGADFAVTIVFDMPAPKNTGN